MKTRLIGSYETSEFKDNRLQLMSSSETLPSAERCRSQSVDQYKTAQQRPA